MAERLVSPDRRLFLIRDNADLEALAELHSMTKSQKGNIKQLLGWNLVGNHTGDRNDRNERKEAANWMLLHNVTWLKHDNGTEYVPLVGKPQHRKRRAKRKRTIVAIDRGEEADGIRREENSRVEMRNEVDGIFSATKYHWLFFALPSPNVKVVPWGTVCKPDECHAVLDEREEGDADEVKGSTSLYEFAGINPRETEAELYLRCFPCQCMVCRNSSLSESFEACPNISQTGRWRRAACHRSHGAVKRAAKKRDDVEAFAKSIAAEKLYAAAGDPKNLERGGRPYWLLRTLGKARKISEKKGVRAWDSPKATTIKKGTWAVRAQWYVSTAIDPNQKRHGYKLLPGYVYVEVKTIIQEHGLEFQHEGRAGSGAECTMRDADHTRVMQHNFASYA